MLFLHRSHAALIVMGGPSVTGRPAEGSAEWDAASPRVLVLTSFPPVPGGMVWTGEVQHMFPELQAACCSPGNSQRVSLGKSSPMFQIRCRQILPRLSSQCFFRFRAYFLSWLKIFSVHRWSVLFRPPFWVWDVRNKDGSQAVVQASGRRIVCSFH